MLSAYILSITTFVYGFAAVLYIAAWVFRKEIGGKAATWVTVIGLIANTAGILLRWKESYDMNFGHAPFSNLYESLVFFSWAIALIYLFLEKKYKTKLIGIFALPIVSLSLAYASLSPNISDRIEPLIPALKSNWLIAHVITCFLGYAGFAIAFGISIMFLLKHGAPGKWNLIEAHFPANDLLDELTHQMIMFGFFFLSIGIITGSVWANSAWGSYWSWDPKETWSLITWFIYAFFLHARLMRGWAGKKIAWVSIAGFLAVLFTYFGVNYLPGLHSYGSM